MTPLTIHLIIQNNEPNIQNFLNSIKSKMNCNIIAGDIGCSDKTSDICKSYGVQVVKFSLNNDISQVRNDMSKLSKTKWNLFLEPWETIISGSECLFDLSKSKSNLFKINLLQEDILTKQNRIWNKESEIKFINPVYETLIGKGEELPLFVAVGSESNKDLKVRLLENWINKNPLANEPIYYKSCFCLTEKNWDAFLNLSEVYLHQEKNDIVNVYMIRYYRCMVFCYIKKNYQEGIKCLLPCFLKKPTMAEFWCLLADCYYSAKSYDKAICFYENAMLLGSRRLKNDDWFMEISKYNDYPKKMIQKCIKIKESSKDYIGKPLIFE